MTTDYTHARSAPVIIIFVKYREKFILVKRSEKMLTYQGLWSCLAGFVDDDKTMEEKVVIEIEEELGLKRADIKEINNVKNKYGIFSEIIRKIKSKFIYHHYVSFYPEILSKRGDIYLDGYFQSVKYFKDFSFQNHHHPNLNQLNLIEIRHHLQDH